MIYIELFFIIGYFITPMDSTVAVITGGSSGIENAIAQVLCAELVLHGISVSLVQSPDAL